MKRWDDNSQNTLALLNKEKKMFKSLLWDTRTHQIRNLAMLIIVAIILFEWMEKAGSALEDAIDDFEDYLR